ncbi:hypothetical protein EAH89_10925 [Roseomonas nepalensis]|uniref:Uncharacterized protein n=2 Tax=Muricoccus nepalensis TaxID=1854500 RepID=A0A502G5V6_9PROT|nr:hypothetical protein EAH89_10925 [Roseomonas nepalensis]
MPEFMEQARINVADAMEHLRTKAVGSLQWEHFARVVRDKVQEFPSLAEDYVDDLVFLALQSWEGWNRGRG